MNEIEREAVRLTAMLSATESWAALYSKTPEQHANLINAEAEMQLVMTKFFNGLQRKAGDFINAAQYNHQLKLAYDVDVIVNDNQIDSGDSQFIKVTFTTVNKMVQAGFIASEVLSNVPSGLPSTAAILQSLTTKEVAALVGKRVQDDGTIIDNPNAEYNIMETVRKDIAQSVKTSLGLGETTDDAIRRVQSVINPIERATLIAQTESVNAYNAGVNLFGLQSNAVGEQWMDAGAQDKCREYAMRGPQPFGTGWDGLNGPTAHPRCKCAKRLIYQAEWDRLHTH